MKIITGYFPVIHRGYVEFFESHRDASKILVFGDDILSYFSHLEKNLPALSPMVMRDLIAALGIIDRVEIGTVPVLCALPPGLTVVMPDEEISREIAECHFDGLKVQFDPVFLRRDRQRTLSQEVVIPGGKISIDRFDREIIGLTLVEAERSSDWFRQVGAAIVSHGQVVLVGHNRHVPSPLTPYAFGDPRANFTKTVNIELSTALHAEANVIAEAAKRGFALEGADLYVSTFPCPPCAKLVAYSGFKRLFFREGYSQLDGQEILEVNGVEIIQVT